MHGRNLKIMDIRENVSLKEYTTFKLGGSARFFVCVKSGEELKEALEFSKHENLQIFVLGGGSNILFSDNGFDGLVIKMEIKGIEWNESKVIVGAGENWDEFVEQAVGRGLCGVENLSGIPGTVGASPVQNIGAYGAEVKDTISWVEVLDKKSGEIKKFSNVECKFGYRNSFFKTEEGKNFIITRVAFNLSKNGIPNITYKDLSKYFQNQNNPTLTEIRNAVIKIRTGKFPDLKLYGTAGSFFKNPIISKEKYTELIIKFPDLPNYPWDNKNVKIPLAWILDNVCKIKGTNFGNVGFYKNQPLVIINLGNATAGEINIVANEIIKKVKEMTGIEIEREVETVF